MASYRSRRRLAATALGLLLAAVAAGCSSSGDSSISPASQAQAPSQQQLYVAKLTGDRQALDRGVLSYSRLGTLKTAATTPFEVLVTDVGKGPQQVQLTAYNGMSVFQRDVPTGGVVGVQVVGCVNLTCHSESGQTQLVLAKGQQAQWWWNVAAGAPGPASITLRADTYDQGSARSLGEEIVNVPVTVVSTPAYRAGQNHQKIAAMAKSLSGDMNTVGSIASGVVAVGAIVGWIIMARRKRHSGLAARQERRRDLRAAGPAGQHEVQQQPGLERIEEAGADQAPAE